MVSCFKNMQLCFEFAMWISAEFKIYLIKEFQRFKDNKEGLLGWDIRRNLSKVNYRIHTDAIKQKLIPVSLNKQQISYVYASEADILNINRGTEVPCLVVRKLSARLCIQTCSPMSRTAGAIFSKEEVKPLFFLRYVIS